MDLQLYVYYIQKNPDETTESMPTGIYPIEIEHRHTGESSTNEIKRMTIKHPTTQKNMRIGPTTYKLLYKKEDVDKAVQKVFDGRITVLPYVYYDLRSEENKSLKGLHRLSGIMRDNKGVHIRIGHPTIHEWFTMDPNHTLYYAIDDVKDLLTDVEHRIIEHQPLEASSRFLKWYGILEQNMQKRYGGGRGIKETQYAALAEISILDYTSRIMDIRTLDNNGYTVDDLSRDDLETLSKEIFTNKDNYLRAVLNGEFVKQERFVLAIKESVANLLDETVHKRFLFITHENIPKLEIEENASVLTKVDADKWITYFNEQGIAFEVKPI